MTDLNKEAFRRLPEDIQREFVALSNRELSELLTFLRRGASPRSPHLHDLFYKLLPFKDELFAK